MALPTLMPTILFEDENLLVINKPAGLLSIPDGYNPELPYLQQVLEPEFGRLWMVHRLDKDTSGVMVLARDPETHRSLNDSFRVREIDKTYHGLVWPVPDWNELVMEQPLKVNADRRHRTRVDLTQGKPTWTRCVILDKSVLAARMAITIRTGLTHQIRAHLREQELILLGENLYNAGLPEPPIPAPRVMLHARELSFQHPTSNQTLSFTAPYPDDFRSVYNLIRQSKGPDAWI
ncbi:MAG: RluA family pseudouridine synthase [Anaerolineaceae bacterium]|nr:RluA family pseudouridine synthase [Anaerolineaceae bacterium]